MKTPRIFLMVTAFLLSIVFIAAGEYTLTPPANAVAELTGNGNVQIRRAALETSFLNGGNITSFEIGKYKGKFYLLREGKKGGKNFRDAVLLQKNGNYLIVKALTEVRSCVSPSCSSCIITWVGASARGKIRLLNSIECTCAAGGNCLIKEDNGVRASDILL